MEPYLNLNLEPLGFGNLEIYKRRKLGENKFSDQEFSNIQKCLKCSSVQSSEEVVS